MEIAPLEHLRVTYQTASPSYKPYDFAKHIFAQMMEKSDRYQASSKGGLLLLLYVTDWHFILSETVIALPQFWAAHATHSFESVFCYSPVTRDSGIPQLIYPTPQSSGS
jgi:hypothetical protein